MKYIYALVKSKFNPHKNSNIIISLLVESVNEYPYNWSAWELLASSCGSDHESLNEVLGKIDGTSPVRPFFVVHVGLNQTTPPPLFNEALDFLLSSYPESGLVKSLSAITYYNNRGIQRL
jgi:anaphase-promoting complex subunit 8